MVKKILNSPTKSIKKYFINFSKKPCWDISRVGLQYDTIENDCELLEISKQQEALQRKSEVQEKLDEKSTKELIEKQSKLREKFIKMNEFLRDCGDKTVRAEEQIENQLDHQAMLKKEIGIIELELNELTTFEETFEKIVKEMQPYEDVLNEAIDVSSTFISIQDLMSQCDAISKSRLYSIYLRSQLDLMSLSVLAQVEIAEREKEFIKGVEIIRQEMLKCTNETSKKIIELMTKLADLEVLRLFAVDYSIVDLCILSKRCYMEAKSKTFKWEKILSKTKDQIAESEKETNHLTDSIQQLYQLLAKRNEGKGVELETNDVEGQLDYIRDEILILEEVIKRAHLKTDFEDEM